MKRIIRAGALAAVAILPLGEQARAQDNVAAIAWTVGMPAEPNGFIDSASFLGFEMFVRTAPWHRTPLWLGALFGLQYFEEDGPGTLTTPTETITGDELRKLRLFPVFLTLHYYAGKRGKTRLFIGAGGGMVYALQRYEIADFDYKDGRWRPTAMAEAGLQLPVRMIELYASGRYNYVMEPHRTFEGTDAMWDYWSASLGLAWSAW